jgi:hypothetical protein
VRYSPRKRYLSARSAGSLTGLNWMRKRGGVDARFLPAWRRVMQHANQQLRSKVSLWFAANLRDLNFPSSIDLRLAFPDLAAFLDSLFAFISAFSSSMSASYASRTSVSLWFAASLRVLDLPSCVALRLAFRDFAAFLVNCFAFKSSPR